MTVTVKTGHAMVSRKTEVRPETLDPIWNAQLEVFDGVFEGRAQVLALIKDQDEYGWGQDDELGQVDFRLCDIALDANAGPQAAERAGKMRPLYARAGLGGGDGIRGRRVTLPLKRTTERGRQQRVEPQGELTLELAWRRGTEEDAKKWEKRHAVRTSREVQEYEEHKGGSDTEADDAWGDIEEAMAPSQRAEDEGPTELQLTSNDLKEAKRAVADGRLKNKEGKVDIAGWPHVRVGDRVPVTDGMRAELSSLREPALQAARQPLVRGDYQLQVHVLEARDLVGRDLNNVGDPRVFVEAFGSSRSTSGRWQTSNPSWDETLFFEGKELSAEALADIVIKVSVYDVDTWKRDELIGFYEFSALEVYYGKDHELWRRWVALTAPFEARDRHLTKLGLVGWTEEGGVQGYLKLSLTLLGPGDSMPVHFPDELDPGGPGGVVQLPPTMKREVCVRAAPPPPTVLSAHPPLPSTSSSSSSWACCAPSTCSRSARGVRSTRTSRCASTGTRRGRTHRPPTGPASTRSSGSRSCTPASAPRRSSR